MVVGSSLKVDMLFFIILSIVAQLALGGGVLNLVHSKCDFALFLEKV